MASDLKPSRTRSKKSANYKLYAVMCLCTVLLYLFFFSTGTTRSQIVRKYDSAASSITQGISGTFKDKSKTEAAKGMNKASSADQETHALVHELKKQAEGDPPSSSLVAANHKPKSTTTSSKDVVVSSTVKQNKGRPKSQAYDPADSLDVLF